MNFRKVFRSKAPGVPFGRLSALAYIRSRKFYHLSGAGLSGSLRVKDLYLLAVEASAHMPTGRHTSAAVKVLFEASDRSGARARVSCARASFLELAEHGAADGPAADCPQYVFCKVGPRFPVCVLSGFPFCCKLRRRCPHSVGVGVRSCV